MSAPQDAPRAGRPLAIVASVVVVATLVVAILVMDSPSAQREARIDQRRVQDLERIVRIASLHAQRHDALPPDLATLAGEPGRQLSINDPIDGTPYGYTITGARSFRLCAVFMTDTAKPTAIAAPSTPDDWNHGSGRQCFDRKLRAEPK
jgi:hypothetical protein